MQLFILTPKGDSIVYGLDDPRNKTVAHLQTFIARREYVAPSAQTLTFAGKQLQAYPAEPLSTFGITEGSSVSLSLRLRGAAQLGKVVKGRSKEKQAKDKGRKVMELESKHRATKESDLARQLALMAKADLKRRMEMEAKNSRMNSLKIQNQWRKIMRLNKVESLRKDIEILSQNHERDVDRNDAIIQMLDRDLEEAEDQYQMALRSHLKNLDALIDLYDAKLLALEQGFQEELKQLEAEFTEEKVRISRQHSLEVQELKDIIAAVEADEQDREMDANTDHEQMREEIRNRNLEEINVLRITLDTQIEDLEQHFETAHLNYLQNTDQRTTDFKKLTDRDQKLSREIEVKLRKIDRLQASIHHWKTKNQQNMRECARRNQLLLEERSAVQGHFQQLKGRMNRYRSQQAQRLTELTKSATESKKSLCERLEVAERTLTLAELARKLETEQEKVLPFYSSTRAEAVQSQAENLMEEAQSLQQQSQQGQQQQQGMGMEMEKSSEVSGGGGAGAGAGAGSAGSGVNNNSSNSNNKFASEGGGGRGMVAVGRSNGTGTGTGMAAGVGTDMEAVDGPLTTKDFEHQTSAWEGRGPEEGGRAVRQWRHIEKFQKKFNKVLLDKLALDREADRLKAENDDLKAILKQYLDGITVNDAVMGSSNPLLVVNGRINLNHPLPVRRQQGGTGVGAGSSSQEQQVMVVDGNHMANTGRINTRMAL